jgi:gentisate 1,2-dioxygenase
MYQYDQGEEMLVCLKGSGEVYLREKWVNVAAGDIAYIPEGVPHGMRNPRSNPADFVLVSQITPPQVDLYEPAGYYDRKAQSLRLDEVQRAQELATLGTLSTTNEFRYREDHPEIRAWNLSREEVRRGGALFNIFKGATYGGIGVPMRILLYPGFGTRTAGLHVGLMLSGADADIHRHPISDDCVFVIEGGTEGHLEGQWVPVHPLEAAMAPCGVAHGGRPMASQPASLVIGFGAPAQLDVYMKSDALYRDGRYTTPPFELLEWPPRQ